MKQLIQSICELEGLSVQNIQVLTGGDINKCFKLTGQQSPKVIKLNSLHRFPKMLQLEAKSLEELRLTNTFNIPEVIAYGDYHQFQYLILDYIEPGTPTAKDWPVFGEQLAQLHQTTKTNFGYTTTNYIGELPQHNDTEVTAANFYIHQRLEPQLKLAQQKNYKLSSVEAFLLEIPSLIPNRPPSLVHGDLWSGNYLFHSKKGFYLIDPAISYSLAEFDLAMMQLFGGFPSSVFEAYRNSVDASKLQLKHLDLFKLYYLLVHLNLFGQSYFSACQNIINKYT